MSWSADFSLDLGIQGCCTSLHGPAEGRRGQAGRLWAGKFEYSSARLLPSVVLNIPKSPEIPFLLLCLRTLLALCEQTLHHSEEHCLNTVPTHSPGPVNPDSLIRINQRRFQWKL